MKETLDFELRQQQEDGQDLWMDDLDNLVGNHLMTYLARDQLDWGDDRLIIKEREPDPNSRGLERLCGSVLKSWIGVIRREKRNQVKTVDQG